MLQVLNIASDHQAGLRPELLGVTPPRVHQEGVLGRYNPSAVLNEQNPEVFLAHRAPRVFLHIRVTDQPLVNQADLDAPELLVTPLGLEAFHFISFLLGRHHRATSLNSEIMSHINP